MRISSTWPWKTVVSARLPKRRWASAAHRMLGVTLACTTAPIRSLGSLCIARSILKNGGRFRPRGVKLLFMASKQVPGQSKVSIWMTESAGKPVMGPKWHESQNKSSLQDVKLCPQLSTQYSIEDVIPIDTSIAIYIFVQCIKPTQLSRGAPAVFKCQHIAPPKSLEVLPVYTALDDPPTYSKN